MVEVKNGAIKWYLSLQLFFCKSADPTVKTDQRAIFESIVFYSVDNQKTNEMVTLGYNQLFQQRDEFQRNGSGSVVDYVKA